MTVRTTITVPIRRYARCALRNQEYCKMCINQGNQSLGTTEQHPLVQGHVNRYQYCSMPLYSILNAETEQRRWAAQARKQRGLV